MPTKVYCFLNKHTTTTDFGIIGNIGKNNDILKTYKVKA